VWFVIAMLFERRNSLTKAIRNLPFDPDDAFVISPILKFSNPLFDRLYSSLKAIETGIFHFKEVYYFIIDNTHKDSPV